jgi:hypothetical protein
LLHQGAEHLPHCHVVAQREISVGQLPCRAGKHIPRSRPASSSARPRSWDDPSTLLSIVFRLVRNLVTAPAAVLRSRVAKDAEVLAPRHENAVLRRQIARVRYEPADRISQSRTPATCPTPDGPWSSRP